MARTCYRNVDKPILVAGLEYQDWAVVLVGFCLFALVPWISNLTVLLLTALCATILRVLKASKPRGYLLHMLYRADETWQAAARHFAESYVMTVANFTPETAQRSFQTALQYLSPAALSLARTQLDEELARMKRDRISSQCVPEGEAEIAYQQDGSITAVVRGQRRIYAGRELISEKPITYRLTIAAVVRSRTYPQGLQIQSVEQELASDGTGKG